jgi:hypothetical protein
VGQLFTGLDGFGSSFISSQDSFDVSNFQELKTSPQVQVLSFNSLFKLSISNSIFSFSSFLVEEFNFHSKFAIYSIK